MFLNLVFGISMALAGADLLASESHQAQNEYISDVGQFLENRESSAGTFSVFTFQGIQVRGDMPLAHFMRALELVEKDLGDLEYVNEVRNCEADPFSETPDELLGVYLVVYSGDSGLRCGDGHWWWFTRQELGEKVVE